MTKKEKKDVNSLRLIAISEILFCFGVLVELTAFSPWFTFVTSANFIGSILMLIGIFRIKDNNKYFFMLYVALIFNVILTFSFSAVNIVIRLNDALTPFTELSTAQSILPKAFSMIFTYTFLRGCAVAATGSIKSKFAKHMLLVNLLGNILSIVLNIVAPFLLVDYPQVCKVLSSIAVFIAIVVEIYLTVFVFRTYRFVKNHFENKKANK